MFFYGLVSLTLHTALLWKYCINIPTNAKDAHKYEGDIDKIWHGWTKIENKWLFRK